MTQLRGVVIREIVDLTELAEAIGSGYVGDLASATRQIRDICDGLDAGREMYEEIQILRNDINTRYGAHLTQYAIAPTQVGNPRRDAALVIISDYHAYIIVGYHANRLHNEAQTLYEDYLDGRNAIAPEDEYDDAED